MKPTFIIPTDNCFFSKKETDCILKIINRVLKDIGLYCIYRGCISKEKFFEDLSKEEKNIYLIDKSAEFFWHYFTIHGMPSNVSSYIVIKLLDNKNFRDILIKNIDEDILISKFKVKISSEAAYMFGVERDMSNIGKNSLLSLKKVLEKYKVAAETIRRLNCHISGKRINDTL